MCGRLKENKPETEPMLKKHTAHDRRASIFSLMCRSAKWWLSEETALVSMGLNMKQKKEAARGCSAAGRQWFILHVTLIEECLTRRLLDAKNLDFCLLWTVVSPPSVCTCPVGAYLAGGLCKKNFGEQSIPDLNFAHISFKFTLSCTSGPFSVPLLFLDGFFFFFRCPVILAPVTLWQQALTSSLEHKKQGMSWAETNNQKLGILGRRGTRKRYYFVGGCNKGQVNTDTIDRHRVIREVETQEN